MDGSRLTLRELRQHASPGETGVIQSSVFLIYKSKVRNMHGGDLIAEALKAHGVRFVFTLCGGHISPILVGCKQRDIRVVDVRHEATAVFAADAVSRLTGVPGVAVVTAGPGATNAVTAVKNAQLAQSPLVLLGGATATALKDRGSLQDIDQMALLRPHVKWAVSVKRVRDLAPAVTKAFALARSGIPGPTFVECPVDLLYDEKTVREWYGVKAGEAKSLSDRLLKLYLRRHLNRLFAGNTPPAAMTPVAVEVKMPAKSKVSAAAKALRKCERPVLLIGSQALHEVQSVVQIAGAVSDLGIPVFLSGMARGLLGKDHPLQMRHQRKQALREADLILLAGVPCDFRLDYGRHLNRDAYFIAVNHSEEELEKNKLPDLAVHGDPGRFLCQLAQKSDSGREWPEWQTKLRARDEARINEIAKQSWEDPQYINPLELCLDLERVLPNESVLVADGGDFVATASYILRPRAPLSWLDPGVFGTLGCGAGFALGAKLCHPDHEVWLIYGDGAAGYSLAEFDTFVRHNIPVIALVGNDAGWSQIAREQVEILQDDVGTVLSRSNYHKVAEGFGAAGFLAKEMAEAPVVIKQAREAAAQGKPVLINAWIGKSDFRKGSISM